MTVLAVISFSLIVIYIVYYFVRKAVKNHKEEVYSNAVRQYEDSKEYKQYCKEADIWPSVRQFLKEKKHITSPAPYKPDRNICGYHITVFVLILCICLFAIGLENMLNHSKTIGAVQKSAMYQEFVDNASDELISTCGNETILDWNNTIVTEREYQDLPFFRYYHLFDTIDWNDVPLVTFNKGD